MKKIAIALAVLVTIPFVLWYVAIPDSSVPAFINSGLSAAGAGITAENFHKTLLLGFKAENVKVTVEGKDAMNIDKIRGAISPLSLLLLRPKVNFSIDAASGTVKGVFSHGLLSGENLLTAEAEGVRLGSIPSIKNGMDGKFDGDLSLEGDQGKLTFEMSGLSNFPYGFTSANGLITINGGALKLESVSLEGDAIYAKVKGDIKNGSYNVVTEIMKQVPQTAPQTAEQGGAPSLEQSLGNFLPQDKMVVPASGTIQGLF